MSALTLSAARSAGPQSLAGCEIIPYAEAPSELLAAFATRMRVGPWTRFHTDKASALYLSPRTDVRIGLEQERGLTRMATVLATDTTDADYTRLQAAANFLFARMVDVPEVTTRREIDDALDKARRSGREAGAERGGVLLVAKPAQDNGLVVRVGRRRCP